MSADYTLLYPTELRRKVKSLERERDELLAALWKIYHHAYDPEILRGEVEADFDRMRDIAYKAINKAKGGE